MQIFSVEPDPIQVYRDQHTIDFSLKNQKQKQLTISITPLNPIYSVSPYNMQFQPQEVKQIQLSVNEWPDQNQTDIIQIIGKNIKQDIQVQLLNQTQEERRNAQILQVLQQKDSIIDELRNNEIQYAIQIQKFKEVLNQKDESFQDLLQQFENQRESYQSVCEQLKQTLEENKKLKEENAYAESQGQNALVQRLNAKIQKLKQKKIKIIQDSKNIEEEYQLKLKQEGSAGELYDI